jgi:hypothetical protein
MWLWCSGGLPDRAGALAVLRRGTTLYTVTGPADGHTGRVALRCDQLTAFGDPVGHDAAYAGVGDIS